MAQTLGHPREAARALSEGLLDGGDHQGLLVREVGIEPAVGHSGFGHDLGDADSVRSLGANCPGGGLHHLLPGLFLVGVAIAHGLARVYMMPIILSTGRRSARTMTAVTASAAGAPPVGP